MDNKHIESISYLGPTRFIIIQNRMGGFNTDHNNIKDYYYGQAYYQKKPNNHPGYNRNFSREEISFLRNFIEHYNEEQIDTEKLREMNEHILILEAKQDDYYSWISIITTIVIGLFGSIFIVGVVYNFKVHRQSLETLESQKLKWDIELNEKIEETESIVKDLSRKFENSIKRDLHEYKLKLLLDQKDYNKEAIYSDLKEISFNPEKRYISTYNKIIELDINPQITKMAKDAIEKIS